MVKAFVFGKFLPFHKGHEAMIRFALTQCDFLSVLICCSDKEALPAEVRASWIRQTFESFDNLEIQIFNYSEEEFPNTSVSSLEVSRIWSEKFKELFPKYNLLITSEVYGDYVASFMGIKHILFDILRKLFPISASAVRDDLWATWDFLPDSVKSYFAVKIVILGTESTGKTTLSESLTKYFDCTLVPETGRELISDSKSFHFEDLLNVAHRHAERINAATMSKSPLVIIDTDIHITMSYARFVFDENLVVNEAIWRANKADLYLYLDKNVPYFQDGTRLSEADRNKLDVSHRKILRENKVEFVELTGSWDARFEMAVAHIKQQIQIKQILLNQFLKQ